MRFRRLGISGLLLLVSTTTCMAQEEWPIQHVDKTAGLSNSAINAIYMDGHDYAWFGTWDGLNRYDGDKVTSFKPLSNAPTTISNNVIRQILEDKSGNLWVVTHDGINRYDQKTNQFTRYLNGLDRIPSVENNLKATLSKDSTLLISLVGWGVGFYREETDSFESLAIEGGVFDNIYDIGAFEDHIYLLDDHGNLLASSKTQSPVQAHPGWKPRNTIYKFVAVRDRYFFAYQKPESALILEELRRGRVIDTFAVPTNGMQITAISGSNDRSGLYLGTNEGAVIYVSPTEAGFRAESLNHHMPDLVKKKLKIFSLYETRNNMLWVGTDGDGVYKYLTKKRSFRAMGEGPASEGKLSNSIVRAIHKDADGTLYVGTRSGGLNVFSPHEKSTKVYDRTNGLSDNTVLAIGEDAKGNIWLGLDNEGIDMLEKSSGKIFHFPRDFSRDNPKPTFNAVYEVFFDSYGHLWLGTSGDGIIYLDIRQQANGQYVLHETYSIEPQEHPEGEIIGLTSATVYTIAQEEPNILWFGARNGGLYRYNTLSRKFTHHFNEVDTDGYSALSNNDILSMYMDHANKLWVGTSGGLNQINLATFSVKQYAQNQGLANNTIHGILEDKEGRFWLSSNNGLFAFSPGTNSFKNFNWTDGLANYEYTDGAYFKAENDDRLYFGGTKGLDIVMPGMMDTTTYFPRLALTGLLISNVEIAPLDSTGILQAGIDLQKSISLRHNQNFLSVRFTTLDYWHKQRCTYRYYLEGFDKTWIHIGTKSDINLTNVPPGGYVLHLNNTNENGDWNAIDRQLVIKISPPFWATKVAYGIYALIALLTQVSFVILLRNRAKRKKLAVIEKLKKEQTDVIQKYKLEFFTDITHEFRTPLTLILGPATTLLEKTKSNPPVHQLIQSIYQNSLRLQKLIQELTQFRKVELGKEKLRIRTLNISQFVEEILQSFRQYALEKEIRLTFETPDQALFVQADSDILEKILINLISNALKYTEPGGQVAVKLWKENNLMYYSVSDTGSGIDESEMSRIFERFNDIHHKGERSINSVGIGLSLTQKLIKLHKGDITVKSTPGEGSDFTFWLPSEISTYEGLIGDSDDHLILTKLEEHVEAEFYHRNALDQEMINISLERMEHTLLAVDDNIQILSLLKELLTKKYNVITCTSAKEALNLLGHRKIDLVISDVIMPEMSGYELCDAIKNRIETSHIPVILLTAKGEMEDRIEGLQAGADAYIPKPFHLDHLHVRVEKLIHTRELLKKKFEAYSVTDTEFASFGIGEKDDAFFGELDKFIKQELGNPQLDAVLLAGHLGTSKTSLYKKIRALTGQTPHALINHYRLKKAAYLLSNSDLNVSEIIYRTGFNSRSYFYKSFQEKYHCSPSAYNGAIE